MNAPDTMPSRRPAWLVVLPVAVLLLLGLAWSGAWFYASGRAQGEIEAWVAREATQGRYWSCGTSRFGGFPFRFELICDQPAVAFSGTSQWKADALRAHAVAQVWDPQHIIAEFQGPAELVEVATGRKLAADWSLLQVSGVGANGRLERTSIAADNYNLTQDGASLFAARHLEIHVRHHPGDTGSTLDLAAGVKGATGYRAPGSAGTPVDGELQAMASAVPEFRSMPPDERLRLWQAAGGRLKLVLGKLSSGNGVVQASGDFGLDARGRPIGEASVAVVGADALLSTLAASGLTPSGLSGLAPMLMAAGTPTEIDGRRAAAFPFEFRDGRVFLGMLPLGKIGSLYAAQPPAP